MAKTVKVRIPVAVDPKGRWYAYAGNDFPRNHDEMLETVDMDQCGPNEALYWVTAELAVPEVQEVTGDIEAVQ